MQQIILNGISIEDFQNQLIGKIKSEFFSTAPTAPKETTEDFLTVKEVAKLLGVSLVTVHKWKKDGKLKFHRFGTRIRFQKSEILNNEKFSNKGK
jgi:excisionase family DNA binding protein